MADYTWVWWVIELDICVFSISSFYLIIVHLRLIKSTPYLFGIMKLKSLTHSSIVECWVLPDSLFRLSSFANYCLSDDYALSYCSSLFVLLQGQDIYKSKQVRDKQIVRILGKVISFDFLLIFKYNFIGFKSYRWIELLKFNLPLNCMQLHLQAPTIAAAAYLRLAGRPPVLPSNTLSYAENFLYMLDSL